MNLSLDDLAKRRAAAKRLRKSRRGDPDIRPRLGDTCPACKSTSVFEGPVMEDPDKQIDACLVCSAIWEREDRKEPELERCGRCAFNPGSPEQADPEEWRKIVDGTVKKWGVFLCHKRVPIDLHEDGTYDYKHRDENGRVVHGTKCDGWSEARCTVLWKEHVAREPAT